MRNSSHSGSRRWRNERDSEKRFYVVGGPMCGCCSPRAAPRSSKCSTPSTEAAGVAAGLAGAKIDLHLPFEPTVALRPGAKLWLFYDIRQDAAAAQAEHPEKDHFYRVVRAYGGMVTGHHHTSTYVDEYLAEMWQKQMPRVDEEERIYELMRGIKRFGLVAGSDTHDSMPSNPAAEPACPGEAGFTGVWAKDLTMESLWEARRTRRVYATSGARIFMKFESNDRPMGAELALEAPRRFQIELDGTAEFVSAELLRDGRPIWTWSPAAKRFSVHAVDQDVDATKPAFYLVRAKQSDNHLGWTSPVWFG